MVSIIHPGQFSLKTSDFYYDLPKDYIAQNPIEPRDTSRLMVIDRLTGMVEEHTRFWNLGRFLNPGDLIVLNETRVIPARLYGKKIPTGGHVELLLLQKVETHVWDCLVGGRGLLPQKEILLDDGSKAVVVKQLTTSRRIIKFDRPPEIIMDELGHMPLPPYIYARLDNPDRYQTVYGNEPGSAAAPTAGLHFTHQLIEQLQYEGISFTSVVLHVGLDTFAPVKEENPAKHEIHSEWCQLTKESADKINQTKRDCGRIVAIGTTSVRVLETAALHKHCENEWVSSFEGYTRLFILPGFEFQVTDSMVTNFHLPGSTLIMMVSAFMGRKKVLDAYDIAKKEGYRFYSFGDAMLIK